MSDFGVLYVHDWQAEAMRKIDRVPMHKVPWTMPLSYPSALQESPYKEFLWLGNQASPPGKAEYTLARTRMQNGIELIVPFQGHSQGTIGYYLGQMLVKDGEKWKDLCKRWADLSQTLFPWDAFAQALFENPRITWTASSTWWKEEVYSGVAVVIPCYDHEKFLPQAVRSALKEGADQVIVVDDGSPGDVGKALRKFKGEPVYVVTHKKNKGLPAARNSGIQASTMKYILSLDADDKLDKGVLASMRKVTSRPKLWAYSDVYLFGKVHQRVKVHVNSRSMRSMQPAHPAVMYSKEAWQFVGGYDESIKGFESWDFHARLIQGGWQPAKANGLIWYRKHEKGGSMLAEVLAHKKERMADLQARNPAYFDFGG